MSFDSQLFWHRTDEFNKAMSNAARRGVRKLRSSIESHGVKDKGGLARKMGQRTKKRSGEIYAIGFRTYRYGLIQEHGSGRGWKKGVRTASGPPTGRSRIARPWLGSVMPEIVVDVADAAARIKGNDLVAELDQGMVRAYGRGVYRIG